MAGFLFYLLLMGLISYTAVLYGSGALLQCAFGGIALMALAYLYIFLQMLFVETDFSAPVPVAEHGGEGRLLADFRNRGIFPAHVRCCISSGQERRGKLTIRAAVGAGKRMSAERAVRLFHCGNARYTLGKIRYYDLTGLFYVTRRCKRTAEISVMPRVYGVAVTGTGRAGGFAVEESEGAATLRPFRDGDPIRSVHWKASARTGELMVREEEGGRGCRAVLLLGLSGNPAERDAALTAAASVSCALAQAGLAHYAAWYDGQRQEAVRMRVDGEEGPYRFLLAVYDGMEQESTARRRSGRERCHDGNYGGANLAERYRERYRPETAVTEISVSFADGIAVDGRRVCGLDGEDLERELGEVVLSV